MISKVLSFIFIIPGEIEDHLTDFVKNDEDLCIKLGSI